MNKLRLRELAEKFHLPYSIAKKIVKGIKGRGVSIVRMRNEPSNVGYRGWGDVPVAKIERGSSRSPFADLLHEAGHVDAGHLGSKARISERGAELLKGAEGYYPRAHHEGSDDILSAARSVLLREKQANRAAGKILKDSGASSEQISAFAQEQRKNFRTYRKSAWRHAVAGERIKNPSATESNVMGVLQRQAERRGVIPSDGALRSARDTVQRQIRMNPINRGRDPIFGNESFGVDGSKSILPLAISEAKRIHKNTSKLWRVREFSAVEWTPQAKAVWRHYFKKAKKQMRGGRFGSDMDGYLPGDRLKSPFGLMWRGANKGEVEKLGTEGRFVSNWSHFSKPSAKRTYVAGSPNMPEGYALTAAAYSDRGALQAARMGHHTDAASEGFEKARIYGIAPSALKRSDNKIRSHIGSYASTAPLRGGIGAKEVRALLKPTGKRGDSVRWRPAPLGEVMRRDFESAKLRLVEFNTFGATRRLLQELKASGVRMTRGPGGSSYSGSKSLINIPKGAEGIGEGVSRRNALFHEAGHAKVNAAGKMDTFHIENYKANQSGLGHADRMKVGSYGNELRRQERLANKVAQSDMERFGVPKENISAFRKDMAGSLNTYRAGHYATPAPKIAPAAPVATSAASMPSAAKSPNATSTPQSPFRKRSPWLAGGVAAGVLGAGYLATRKPNDQRFSAKLRLRELATIL